MIVSVWVLAEDRPSHDCFSWNVVLWFHLKSHINEVEGMKEGGRGERCSFSSS